jgi:hypothetical protein
MVSNSEIEAGQTCVYLRRYFGHWIDRFGAVAV